MTAQRTVLAVYCLYCVVAGLLVVPLWNSISPGLTIEAAQGSFWITASIVILGTFILPIYRFKGFMNVLEPTSMMIAGACAFYSAIIGGWLTHTFVVPFLRNQTEINPHVLLTCFVVLLLVGFEPLVRSQIGKLSEPHAFVT